ncbi:MAG TPA: NfeD family protein [Thermoanaerobaculia bacterium]|nr:NfeD family protein [Thermoanaerobaculia bacterium]
MTWESFYLLCFVVGFVLALLAFLTGVLHWPLPDGMKLPHFPGHGAPLSHAGHGGGTHAGDVGSAVSPFNFASLMAFLAWFGGAGYLLTGGGHFSHLIVLVLAAAVGLAGGAIVFVFLAKVLLRHERALEAADFDMVGVLGRVTMPIREGGTGEIVYSQGGTRRSAGARSEVGQSIARGSEVVVTRYERGIAYVRLWEELAREEAVPQPPILDRNSPEAER